MGLHNHCDNSKVVRATHRACRLRKSRSWSDRCPSRSACSARFSASAWVRAALRLYTHKHTHTSTHTQAHTHKHTHTHEHAAHVSGGTCGKAVVGCNGERTLCGAASLPQTAHVVGAAGPSWAWAAAPTPERSTASQRVSSRGESRELPQASDTHSLARVRRWRRETSGAPLFQVRLCLRVQLRLVCLIPRALLGRQAFQSRNLCRRELLELNTSKHGHGSAIPERHGTSPHTAAPVPGETALPGRRQS